MLMRVLSISQTTVNSLSGDLGGTVSNLVWIVMERGFIDDETDDLASSWPSSEEKATGKNRRLADCIYIEFTYECDEFFLGETSMLFETIEPPLNVRGKRIVSPLSSFMRPGDRIPKPTREDDTTVFFDLLHPVSIPRRGDAMAFFGRLFCPPFMLEKRTDDSCARGLLSMISSPNTSKGDKIICAEWVDSFFIRRLSLVGVSCPKDFLSRFSPMEWDMKFSQLINSPRTFTGIVTESDIVRIISTFASFTATVSASAPAPAPTLAVSSSPKIIAVKTPEERDVLINDMIRSHARVIFITRYSVSSMSVRASSTGVVTFTFSRFLRSATLRDIVGDASRRGGDGSRGDGSRGDGGRRDGGRQDGPCRVTILLEDPTVPVTEKASTMEGCEVITLKTSPAEITIDGECPEGKLPVRIVSSADKIPQQKPDDLKARRVIVGGSWSGKIFSSPRIGECGTLVHKVGGLWFMGDDGVETKVNIDDSFINGDVILPHHAHGRRFDVPVIVDRDVKILPFMSSSAGILRE